MREVRWTSAREGIRRGRLLVSALRSFRSRRMKTICEMFQGKDRLWYWRCVTGGKEIDRSTDGYKSRWKCRRSLKRHHDRIKADQIEYRNLFRDTKSEGES